MQDKNRSLCKVNVLCIETHWKLLMLIGILVEFECTDLSQPEIKQI